MKNKLALIVFLFAPLLVQAQTIPAAAGRSNFPEVRVLTDVSVGGGSFSFVPDINFGLAVEIPIGQRFEAQANVMYSPFTKQGFGGYTLTSSGGVIVWVNHRIGINAGINQSAVQFGGTFKNTLRPFAGVVIRDSFGYGMPGRLYVNYEKEIGGCTFATPTNPCPITSSELQGVTAYQEFIVGTHWRVGAKFGVYRFGDQVNPFAPNVPQEHSFGGEGEFVLRFSWSRQTDSQGNRKVY